MWWKNVRLMALLIVVAVFLIYLFVGFGCGLPGKVASSVERMSILTGHRLVEMRWQPQVMMASHQCKLFFGRERGAYYENTRASRKLD